MVKTPSSNAEDVGSIPGWETNIPHATRYDQISFLKKWKQSNGGNYIYKVLSSFYDLKVNYIGYTPIKYKKLNKTPHNTQLKDWTLM